MTMQECYKAIGGNVAYPVMENTLSFIAIILMISQYFRFVSKTVYDMLIHQ